MKPLDHPSTDCQTSDMRVHLCGVRGSTPASGAEFARYGGHTACVALAHDDEPPSLVLDAGTGLRTLSRLLGDKPFRGTIVCGHLHWDHVQGFPFFPAGNRDDSKGRLLIPAQPDGAEATTVLARSMAPPHFPIRPHQLLGNWGFGSLAEGDSELEGFRVTALDIPHGGGRTFGFRVSDESGTVAYLSDHSPSDLGPGPDGLGAIHPTACALAADADVLLHDAQHLARELTTRPAYGHATVEYALGLAAAAGVGSLVLYHHDPERSDQELDAIADSVRRGPQRARVAVEGETLVLAGAGR